MKESLFNLIRKTLFIDQWIRIQNELKVRIKRLELLPQSLIKWLEIYLDPKLLFHGHVKREVCEVTGIFHQIERLSNSVRGLSFQAVRQLYIACII